MARILVVDDSNMSRRIVRSILEGAGHEIVEATDGMAALEQYSLSRPQLVLLDLVMSGMYGIDVLKKLIEMDANAKVVIASADIQNFTRTAAMEAGAAAFVTKPIAGETLLQTVGTVLGDEGK
jgi:two-component system, chemotaxis family, chemotaxis protein CheY